MQGDVGMADGSWFYVVRLRPVEGLDDVLRVAGFASEADARRALKAADPVALDAHRRIER